MATTKVKREIRDIAVDDLRVNPNNPRANGAEVANMVESVKARGIIQPLVAYANAAEPGTFMLKAGHRRLAAAIALKLDTVPVVLIDPDDVAGDVQDALIENTVREGLSTTEMSRGIAALFEQGVKPGAIGKPLGMSAAEVNKHRALATAPSVVQAAVDQGLGLDDAAALADLEASHPDLYAEVEPHIGTYSMRHALTSAVLVGERRTVEVAVQAEAETGGPRFVPLADVDGAQVALVTDLAHDRNVKLPKKHEKLACHGVTVATDWVGNKRQPVTVPICTDVESHMVERPAENPDGTAADAAKEAEREARREVVRRNKEGIVANEIRREWIQKFKARKKYDTTALVYAAGVIARQGAGNNLNVASVATAAFGVENTHGIETVVAKRITDGPSATRFLVHLALDVAEQSIEKDFWRSWRVRDFAAHLRGLVVLGYEPTEAELAVIAEQTPGTNQ